MQEIVANPWIYEVASYDIRNSNLKYETPCNVFNQGVKEIWEVELEDGTTIRATPDHKFLVGEDWLPFNK
jgi:intein/homing endonuclease